MKNNYFKFLLFLFCVTFQINVFAQLTVNDHSTFNTRSQMFLANELFDSGEPFAEALGYNLDDLDPMVANLPDSLSYTLGIENYEYSRYLLNTLNGRSGMGLHIMWSPVISQMAAMQPESFDGTFTGGTPNGFKEDDMLMMTVQQFGAHANQSPPANPFPIFADFMSGDNNLPQTVAANFQMDWSSTRWNRDNMQKILSPGAMGQSMMKQYLWAKDMLGAFHNAADEGITADGNITPDFVNSPNFDPNNNVFYGGNNIDGFIGQMLTASAINKTMHLVNFLAYDGSNLGSVDPATYDPANGIKYFPHQVAITESSVNTMLPPKRDATMTVVDASSQLFDQLSFLWATSGFKNMMNPTINDAEHYAYHEVFDGSPFPAAMSQTGTAGPYDLMTGTSKVIFLNIMAMHHNATVGTFVDEANFTNGTVTKGNTVSAKEASYLIVILSQFANEFSGTPLESAANNAIIEEANFIINNMKDTANGGFFNSFTIGSGASNSPKLLGSQAAIVRGLYAAYNHTNDNNYLTEANAAYQFMMSQYYLSDFKSFKTTINNDTANYDTEILALVVGALREAKLTGNQTDAPLVLMRFGKSTIDKMLLAEAEQSGEDGSLSDNDGIPYIAGNKKPFVFANTGTYSFQTAGVKSFDQFGLQTTLYPNPSDGNINLELLNSKETKTISLNVFDILGKKVFTSQPINISIEKKNTKINLSQLSSGTYFLKIIDIERNLSIDNKKIIIQ